MGKRNERKNPWIDWLIHKWQKAKVTSLQLICWYRKNKFSEEKISTSRNSWTF